MTDGTSKLVTLRATRPVTPHDIDPPVSTALADDACRCQGCGCKGGAGWRGPDGACVPRATLAQVCGSPAGAPCKQENASRVCFGKQSSLSAAKAKTLSQ